MFINFWDCPLYNLQVSYNQDNFRSSPKSGTIATQVCPGALLVGALPGGQRLGMAPADVTVYTNAKRRLVGV